MWRFKNYHVNPNHIGGVVSNLDGIQNTIKVYSVFHFIPPFLLYKWHCKDLFHAGRNYRRVLKYNKMPFRPQLKIMSV